MSSRLLLGAAVCAALVLGGIWYLSSRRSDEAPSESRSARPAAEAPRAEARPAPEPSSPSPAAPARPTRRAPVAEPPAPEAVPEAAPELGTLRIDADVPGAQVFIDRQYVGTTPLTADQVKPGTHQLNVTAEGFEGIAQTVDVEPGPRDLMFRFREVRLNATLAVVHKHRIGSCRGQLVATADGIHYDTTDKEDGFSVPLSDLETFVVDYQEKNLRIKLRKGKQYNFTDPDGNADRLFVFHRDVDKVRGRVK